MSNEITNDKNINIHSLSKVITSNDTSSFRKAAIINSICKYDGWKHLTDIDIVKYGFYFNTDIKMIDVLVPDEVINNKQMIPKYSNLPYYINIEKNKVKNGNAELMNFLIQGKRHEKFDKILRCLRKRS
ncbi:uncharacterized protein LOC126906796 isoform X3 [Daktulosphaira vitifoliae]|uniref:uncharacterized protein LOC126906796 isoform X3 n=1 Tax=Daktulosphaira vitifoliae TaxID=58002 RepID=UPI0021AA82EB|nr:uncharacterized protein LOC126906796 isoform X3 [Daktulosphaira vitifoliae]